MVRALRKMNIAALIQTDDHEITSGVNKRLGGDDEGLDPHELLEAALAACTVITAQMYANRKGWDLHSTDAIVKIVKEEEETEIDLEVAFHGNLSEEQKKRLFEIANKCPVHKILERKIHIKSHLEV